MLFSFFPGADVTTVGLFNDDGELEAFGALRGAGVSSVMPTRVEFASCQVLVRRVVARSANTSPHSADEARRHF